ncbi:MAG TPA: phospholipase D family protein [Gammaproteobacteria bacterium]|nr:phospholipase D family protein [Gammaproteobacteria bacterium]
MHTNVLRLTALHRAGVWVRMYAKNLALGVLFAVLTVPMSAQASYYKKYSKLSASCTLPHPPRTTAALTGGQAIVDFSPGGDGEELILQAIDAAQHTILVQAYSFTDRRIITALVKARTRGVEVRVILDKTDAQPYEGYAPVASVISAERIPVWIDDSVHIAHNKVMIIDGKDLITGSYNFTYSADYNNAENLLVIRNAPELIEAYIDNWKWRQSCSQPYNGRPSN